MKKAFLSILLAFSLALGFVGYSSFAPSAPAQSASALAYAYAPGWSGTQVGYSGDGNVWRYADRWVQRTSSGWGTPRFEGQEFMRTYSASDRKWHSIYRYIMSR